MPEMESRPTETLRVGLLGLGTVGGGVARFLLERGPGLARQFGCNLELVRVLVRDLKSTRSVSVAPSLLTTNANEVISGADVDVIVEVIGGEEPAAAYMRRSLQNGKHLVTANKEVMAKHGLELLRLADDHDVDLYYEASVGGGLPLIGPFKRDLIANRIHHIRAIINGTTNYILTSMAQTGTSYDEALRQAQALGYAESDPHNDVAGVDAGYKLAILATLAFHSDVKPWDVYQEGIQSLSPKDFRFAAEMGYAIKLLAIAREENGEVEARVHPVLLPTDFLLAQVHGVFNAVELEGDLVGRVIFYGRGAGSAPTSSAVIADLIDLARNVRKGISNRTSMPLGPTKPIRPIDDVITRYYVRLEVLDHPGVLAAIAGVMARHDISIASVIQKETNQERGTAEIVLTTHQAKERSMALARKEVVALRDVVEIAGFVRIEQPS